MTPAGAPTVFVINDGADTHAVNVIAPALLAEEAKKLGAAVVHYSTDYVFDGSKAAPSNPSLPANFHFATNPT
jgi:dTDP-4-dehydrorhamnose reductase